MTLLRLPLLLIIALPAFAASVSTSIIETPGIPWKRHTIDKTSRGADGVKLGDINGDGRPDIVTGWEEGGEVRLYINPGAAQAKAAWPRVTIGKVTDAEDAIFTDLDGDGRLDVISCTEGRTRTVYWHRHTGSPEQFLTADRWTTQAFPVTADAQAWMQAITLDLDGRHGPDLLLGAKGKGSSLGWLEAPVRPDDLAGWKFHPLRPTEWIMSLLPCDMDGDGDIDVVFSDRYGGRTGVFWLENPGAAANRGNTPWREHPVGGLGRQAMFADLADLDGDGRLDVVLAAKPHDILVCLQGPDGVWRELSLTLDPTNIGTAKSVKAADLNGDGLLDLVFTCENAAGGREGVVWLERQRTGPWKQRTLSGPEGVKFDLTQILDLDGDGDLDVLTCEETDQLGVVWYENPFRR